MPTQTTKLGLDKPIVNSAIDEDLWGGQLNSNMDILDDAMISGKQTIPIVAAGLQPTSSNGCGALSVVETTAGRPDIIGLPFDGSADEFAQFQIPFPKQWDEGTVSFEVQWTVGDANAGTVVWTLEAVYVDDDGTIDVAYGTSKSSSDTALGVAEDLHLSPESSSITIAGTPAIGGVVFFRIGRNATGDSYTTDATLISIRVFYTTDKGNDA